MQPQYPYQPQPQPVQPTTNPYDFIVNPSKPPKNNPIANGSMFSRLLVVSGGLVVLLVLFVIVKGLLGGGDAGTKNMIGVAQRQQEIVRITSAASDKPGISSDNKNFAITTKLSVTSAESDLKKYLASQGTKLKPQELALKKSAATDEQLKAADAASTYDTTLQQVMKTQLTLYQQELQRAYQKTTGTNGRALLKKQYADTSLLLKQLQSYAAVIQ
ncbi:MAG: hypothetical protein JWM81_683 [Candidatus Saccharibacteria bacterium]|nr:hypothetical protein [Candidatus Saccharibacteria bacterium]